MNPAKHDPPVYLGEFVVRRIGAGYEVVVDEVVARSADGVAFSGGEPTRGDFAVAARVPGDPGEGFDVLDQRGEALAFFRTGDGELELHSPSLDVTAPLVSPLVLTWFERLVLRADPAPDGYAVTVPDRRIDLRVAVSVLVVIDRLGP